MKKFTLMILLVSAFFVGLGGLIENVGARFKSDERAVEIMRLARQAIGGEVNINAVQSLSVKGKATKTFNFETNARTETGDWELHLQSPDKISKMLKIGAGSGSDGEQLEKKINVVVVRKGDGTEGAVDANRSSEKITIMKKDDRPLANEEAAGNPKMRRQILTENIRGDVEKFHGGELFRTMLFLLLTAPPNSDANYIYAGDATIDGVDCEIVQVNSGGASVKLFFNKSSHLPVMASYTGAKPMVFRVNKNDASADGKQEVTVFANQKGAAQTAEFQIKFSDYRGAGSVQMPYKWTQTIDGGADETIDVTSYEINPANIAEKFQNLPPKVLLRTEKKPQ